MSLFSKVFKYVWPQMRKYKWAFYFIVVSYIVRISLELIAFPVFFKQLIDLFSTHGPDYPSVAESAFRLLFIMIAIDVFVFCIARITKFTYYKFSANVVRELRNLTFQNISRHSYTFFSNVFSGSLVTKSRRFTTGFENAVDVFFWRFLKVFTVGTGSLIVLYHQIPEIGRIFCVWIVINFSISVFMLSRKIKYDLADAEQDSRISGRLADVFGNILAVKFFSASKREADSFGQYTKEGETKTIKASFRGGLMDLIQHGMITIVELTVIYVMIKLWLKGSISVGIFVLVETYLVIIATSLWDLSDAMVRFMKSITDMKETVDIFEINPDIQDPKNPEKVNMKNGLIKFENVYFKYQIGENILSDFNLVVNPGERVGIVGHSGAGKSTLTKLILRFNDITGGEITIDGQDIRKVTQDDLRSVISYVPQEPILFHRPIKENINYGKPDATKQEIIEVAKKAHADEFISKLSKGYDTLVGERGVKLSGGERQRVAIARAMLKDSPILILDEATSSLDSISESYIQDAFNELMKGKTTIVIAHRLSTIQKMDRIIVLDAGKIVEEGTHTELLAKNGMYKELWDHQTGGFLE